MRDNRSLSYAELIVAMVLWASLFPAGRPVLAVVPAGHVSLVRAVVAFVVLLGLVLVRGKGHELVAELTRRPWASGSSACSVSSLARFWR